MTSPLTYQEKAWLQHYQKGVPEKVSFKDICLPDMLEQSATRFPDKMALNFQGYETTFGQLQDMVNNAAAHLHHFGIGKGDTVAILLPNVIPCVVAYYACLKLGAIVVMNNPLYSDRELLHQFNDSEATLLITLDLLTNRMVNLRPQTKIKQILYTSIGDYLPFPKSLLFRLFAKKKGLKAEVTPAKNLFHWKKLTAESKPTATPADIKFDDIAQFQYTGGTTGTSKGVILTHGNLSKQVQQLAAWFPGWDENNIMLGALPFFHVFGLTTSMNLAIYFGVGNVLVPKPQPAQLLQAIKKYKVTFAPLVPTMFIGMLQHPNIDKVDLTSIQGCFSGSAPLPVEVIKEFESRTGAIIVEGYGLTETSPVTHINPFGEGSKRKIGSIGVPISDTTCKVVDITDSSIEMPIGEPGELLIKGPQVMKGYLKRAEETATTLSDGWVKTGDIAIMDEEGYFQIVDRKKDMIISSGYNIYPRDIEEIYYEHPDIQEAAAIGIPHSKRGEAVKVFIVMKEGKSATEENLILFCKDKIAKYKWPVAIEFREELPKTNVGKVLKKVLKEEQVDKPPSCSASITS
ncbi:MAG: long-chain fatty acid--CoA ligase [Desulfobulbaceae bacterium]|nr:MAG: long-chain fatty acid--CoA ligase [Desulfobulbaceae bacterium]